MHVFYDKWTKRFWQIYGNLGRSYQYNKKNICELIYSKKYLTAKKHSTKKKVFNVFIGK